MTKRKQMKLIGAPIGAAWMMCMVCTTANGAMLYWDTNGSVAGAGNPANGTWGGPTDTTDANWNTAADGTGTPGAYVAGSDTVFSAGTDTITAAITLNTAVTANSLTFADGTNTLSGLTNSSADSITVGAGGITVNSGATFSTNTAATGVTGSINILAGASENWANNGSGTLLIATGGTAAAADVISLTAGTIQIGNAGTNNVVTGSGTLNVNGATLLDSLSSGGYGSNTLIFTSGTFASTSGKGLKSFTLAGDFTIDNTKNASNWTAGSLLTLAPTALSYTLSLNTSSAATSFSGMKLVGTSSGQTLKLSTTSGSNATSVGFLDDGSKHPSLILAGGSTAVYNLNNGTMQGDVTLQGGTGVINAANTITSGSLTTGIVGIGTFHLAGGTLAAASTANNTIASNVNIDGSLTFGSTTAGRNSAIAIDGTSLTTPSTVTLTTTPVLTIVQPTTIADAISGNGYGLTKAGIAALTLTGTDTYTGATAVNSGTFSVDATSNSTAALAGTSSLTVAGGALFKLINNTATSGANMLNANATVSLATGATAEAELDLNGQLQQIASLTINGMTMTSGIYGSAQFFGSGGGGGGMSLTPSATALADESYFSGNGAFSVGTAIPEPGTFAALSGAAMLLLGGRRRKRIEPTGTIL